MMKPPIGFAKFRPWYAGLKQQGGSSFSPLSLSPLAWARTPAPIGSACTIALDGSAFASLGYSPADVSGQTASVTGAASGLYGAGTSPRPMPTSGIVWVASKDIAYSGTEVNYASSLVIVGYDSSGDPITTLYFGSNGTDQGAGVGTSPFLGPLSGLTGGTIGVGHDGEVYAYDRGTGSIIKASDVDPGFAGAFAGAVTLRAGVLIDSSSTVTASVPVVTRGADMVDIAGIAGTGEDWCGNPLQVVPHLYQDSAGTTPVTGAGQDVGLREDQSGNSADFAQATATARPTYEGDRLEYDVDDALSCTLPAISGGQIVIISPAGTFIRDFDFAGGTFTVGPDTYTGGPAGLMSQLGNAEIEIIILSTPMTEAEQAKMVAYAQGLGSAGLIARVPTALVNGSFDSSLAGWTSGSAGGTTGFRWLNGKAVADTANPSGGRTIFQSVLTSGKTYICDVDVTVVSGQARAYYFMGAPTFLTSGHNSFIFTADDSRFGLNIGVDASAEFDNVVLEELVMP